MGGWNYYVRNIKITYIVEELKEPDTDSGSLNAVGVHHGRRGISTKAGTQNNIHCAMFEDAGD